MKLFIVVGIICLCLTGCASLHYQTADGTTVSYTRLFTTADSTEATVGNASIKVNGQKIDAATLNALLGLLNSTGK
jgi:uncharacterized protein YceK